MKIDPTFQFSEAQTQYQDLGEWWRTFRSEELNQLVQKALENNTDIQSSLASIKQQEASLTSTKASQLPSLSGRLSASQGSAAASDSFSLSLNAAYTVDLFGGNEYDLSAAELTVLKTVETYRTQQATVVKNTVNLWLTINELNARIDMAEKQIINDIESAKYINQRYQSGLSSQTELLQARQQAINNKMSLPVLKSSLETSMTSLQLIIGEYPNGLKAKQFNEFTPVLPIIQAGIPSELIKRRSDIRTALLDLKIADQQVGAAVAAKYPSLSLTAAIGTSDNDLGNIINPDYAFWNLVSNISAPLIDSGGREAAVRRQEAILETKVLAFKRTVLTAFKEVVDALTTINAQKEVIDLINQQTDISEQLLRQSLSNYTQGLGSWSDVLDAQNQYFSVRDSLISAKKELLSDNISLLTALGESWTRQRAVEVE